MQQNLIRLPKVLSRVGYSRSALYAKIKSGVFPKLVAIGARSVAWLETEIDDWIERQIAQSRKAAT